MATPERSYARCMKNLLSRLRDRLRSKGTTVQGGDNPSDKRITTEVARHGGLGRPPMLPDDDRPKH
jgi:hypothetical protein